jgi:hypothetical protein|tara:strand:+ start:355 stop:1203 length:849 start_codon:yes stop_codon:yes gene_type:complete
MPKKNSSKEVIEKYLEKIKEEKNVSEGTLKTYNNIAKSIPFNILTSQKTIIKKLKESFENPNTQQLNLNLIILVRRNEEQENDQLIKLRNKLRDEIQNKRKEGLKKLDEKLPSIEDVLNQLNESTGIRYIVNHLMLNNGLRNKDINLKFVKKLPEEKNENYIYKKGKQIILYITDYKTQKSHGVKEIKINDEKFINEFKSLKLNENDYLLPMKDGTKITNISTFNDKIIGYTINKLGQTKLFKIRVKDLLSKKKYDEIEIIAKDRGTSLDMILKSYNLFNTS